MLTIAGLRSAALGITIVEKVIQCESTYSFRFRILGTTSIPLSNRKSHPLRRKNGGKLPIWVFAYDNTTHHVVFS